jgi:hypothetical protein
MSVVSNARFEAILPFPGAPIPARGARLASRQGGLVWKPSCRLMRPSTAECL